MGATEPTHPATVEIAVSPTAPAPEPTFFPDPELVAIALKSGRIGIWCWEIATNRITWSTNLEDIHALPRGSFDGSLSKFESDMEPHDRADVLAAIQET